MHVTDSDVTFCDGPGMLTVKAAKQVYNSTRIALLTHGFVLVKTWLLIACGTGFYAIIHAIIYLNDLQTHRISFVLFFQLKYLFYDNIHSVSVFHQSLL